MSKEVNFQDAHSLVIAAAVLFGFFGALLWLALCLSKRRPRRHNPMAQEMLTYATALAAPMLSTIPEERVNYADLSCREKISASCHGRDLDQVEQGECLYYCAMVFTVISVVSAIAAPIVASCE